MQAPDREELPWTDIEPYFDRALQLDRWTADLEDPPPDPERMRAETRAHIGAWNALGRTLCSAFLDAAERALGRAA